MRSDPVGILVQQRPRARRDDRRRQPSGRHPQRPRMPAVEARAPAERVEVEELRRRRSGQRVRLVRHQPRALGEVLAQVEARVGVDEARVLVRRVDRVAAGQAEQQPDQHGRPLHREHAARIAVGLPVRVALAPPRQRTPHRHVRLHAAQVVLHRVRQLVEQHLLERHVASERAPHAVHQEAVQHRDRAERRQRLGGRLAAPAMHGGDEPPPRAVDPLLARSDGVVAQLVEQERRHVFGSRRRATPRRPRPRARVGDADAALDVREVRQGRATHQAGGQRRIRRHPERSHPTQGHIAQLAPPGRRQPLQGRVERLQHVRLDARRDLLPRRHGHRSQSERNPQRRRAHAEILRAGAGSRERARCTVGTGQTAIRG